MPKFPWTYRTMRRPRRLTWYLVITQFFTLIGRMIGRAAVSKNGFAAGAGRKPARRRR